MARNVANTLLKGSALLLIAGLAAGCATTQQVEEARALAEEAKQAAAQADQRAANAGNKADQAKATADAAMRKAEEANRCCQETNEKIDRMFKKSMQK